MVRLSVGCTGLVIKLTNDSNYTLALENATRVNDSLLLFYVDGAPDQVCHANVALLLDNGTTVLSETFVDFDCS